MPEPSPELPLTTAEIEALLNRPHPAMLGGGDSLSAYVTVARTHELLEAREEKALGNLVQLGRTALLRQEKSSQVSEEERIELQTRINMGQMAAKTFAEHNLQLVINVAKEYARNPLVLADIISMGNLGLMRAIQEYDAETGNRFTSFAIWKIRGAIAQELRKNRAAQGIFSQSELEKLTQIASAQQELAKNEQPTSAQAVANITRIPVRIVYDLLARRASQGSILSLDEPWGEDDTLLSAYEGAEDPIGDYDDAAELTCERLQLHGLLRDVLTDREYEIIKLYIVEAKSTAMIAEHFHLSRNIINKHIRRAGQKLTEHLGLEEPLKLTDIAKPPVKLRPVKK